MEDKVLVFDFDGTLLDSEYYHFQGYRYVLNKFGHDLTYDEYLEVMGTPELEIYVLFKEKYHISFDSVKMRDEKLHYVLDLMIRDEVPCFEEVAEEIRNTPGKKYILSTDMVFVMEAMLKQWGLDRYFDGIISTCNGDITKPSVLSEPEKYFGVPKEKIVVYEDNNFYLASAKKQGYQTVGIIHKMNKSLFEETNCDRIIDVSKCRLGRAA